MNLNLAADRDALLNASIETKVSHAKAVLGQALDRFPHDRLAVAVTGGKDSTLALWLLREVCRERNIAMPRCLFIDEGDVFDEINDFVARIEKEWDLAVVRMQNTDVTEKIQALGEMVEVASLGPMNRQELAALDFTEERFPFEPESYVGNHLMKTVPMKMFLKDYGIQALVTAIRWDEQTARAREAYFSPRENPDHTRVHPILHFSERNVWQAIHRFGIPFCSLYYQGYRSLGARSTTGKLFDLPAWEQDLENTPERAGRSHGKEAIMDQLRDLGYM